MASSSLAIKSSSATSSLAQAQRVGPVTRPRTRACSTLTHHGHTSHQRRDHADSTGAPHLGGFMQHADVTQVLQRVEAHCSAPVAKQDLIVMFTAPWCGPCTLVHKELSKLSALRKAGTLSVLSVNLDLEANKAFATSVGITSLPTLVFIGRDQTRPAICTVGPVSSALIADVLDNKMQFCGADLKVRLKI